VFFDDILVYNMSWEDRMTHLREVLIILQQHQLVVNQKKCTFVQQEVKYLGHIISARGVAVDPNKVKSVREWPMPQNTKGVRGFLGQTGYYRKFIQDYGKRAKPLTELTKKGGFKWNSQAKGAFDWLKQQLSTAPWYISAKHWRKEI